MPPAYTLALLLLWKQLSVASGRGGIPPLGFWILCPCTCFPHMAYMSCLRHKVRTPCLITSLLVIPSATSEPRFSQLYSGSRLDTATHSLSKPPCQSTFSSWFRKEGCEKGFPWGRKKSPFSSMALPLSSPLKIRNMKHMGDRRQMHLNGLLSPFFQSLLLVKNELGW